VIDDRIERAREKLGTPGDVLREHGHLVRGRMARCPFHEDNEPSMSLYRGDDGVERWRCHSCDVGGDVLDLEQRLSNATLAELLDELVPEIDSRFTKRETPAVHDPKEYLRSRGITDEILIRHAQITYSADRVWLPWLDSDGKKIYSSGRATNGGKPKYVHTKGHRPPLFATPAAWQSRRVVVTEGHIDALAAAQAGHAAFATTGTAIPDAAVEILVVKDQVMLAADVDDPGKRWHDELVTKLKGRVEIAEVKLPEGCKDLADVAQLAHERGEDPSEVVADVLEHALVTFPGPFRMQPLDYGRLKREGIPEIQYLLEPYIPAGARIWAWGAAESGKSLWALAMAAELTRSGVTVVYVSQENPLAEDLRRLERLRPEWSHMRFFHDQGLDVNEPEHVAELVRQARGAGLVILDTLSAGWSGDEQDNAAIAAFDRDVMQLIVREIGASILVLDHIGHPQAFVKRRGVTAGRGASSKGQKADVVLEFKAEAQNSFVVHHAKNRMGGHKQPPRQFVVMDAEDGSLELKETDVSRDDKIAACADGMVEAIVDAGQMTARALWDEVKQFGGKRVQLAAMALLRAEDPPRVVESTETVMTEKRGKQKAKVWRPAGEQLL
jgi:5S rRNA maturation endonuclease (ribonuclease M5)/adenosyl cobinamide kinase/adenosyl cobinamide phosphate guanylyltransferase